MKQHHRKHYVFTCRMLLFFFKCSLKNSIINDVIDNVIDLRMLLDIQQHYKTSELFFTFWNVQQNSKRSKGAS